MELIMTVGISGSGKSYFIKNNFVQKYDKVVCPDNIRKELTGDISNITQDGEVWRIAKERTVNNLLNHGYSIFDATFVDRRLFRNVLFDVQKHIVNPSNVMVRVYIFAPNLELSLKRIKDDIYKNIYRSHVPVEIVHRQLCKLKTWFKSILVNDGFDDFPFSFHFTFINSENGKIITIEDFESNLN